MVSFLSCPACSYRSRLRSLRSILWALGVISLRDFFRCLFSILPLVRPKKSNDPFTSSGSNFVSGSHDGGDPSSSTQWNSITPLVFTWASNTSTTVCWKTNVGGGIATPVLLSLFRSSLLKKAAALKYILRFFPVRILCFAVSFLCLLLFVLFFSAVLCFVVH